MKITGITQARFGSSRFPGKILQTSGDKTMLEHHLRRIGKSQIVQEWIVATTEEPEAKQILEIASQVGFKSFQGSTHDVLDRFYNAVKNDAPDWVVRVTSDCPLLDARLIDLALTNCMEQDLVYYCNAEGNSLPDGMDVEVFRFSALEDAWKHASLPSDREHVTPYIRKSMVGKLYRPIYPIEWKAWSNLRLTFDEPADLVVLDALISKLGADLPWEDYARELEENPELYTFNKSILRNEGYLKSIMEEVQLRKIENFTLSDAYRAEIHRLIPGGAHTYSKGDDQFPQKAPAAFTHGKGSHVWDPDGNEYLDCSMGLTSVTLGHAFTPIVDAVKAELDHGVNFQRPSVLEKTAAERFLALVPQHDMIKFAKNGSIVTTAAVKLARAKTGRKLVAFPGDHPFYSYDDWFIGKTVCNKGVPDEISNLSVTFSSCNLASLEALFEKYPNQIACVITEPEKNQCGNGCSCNIGPGEFLQKAIEITHKHGALFILDEMITGFKTALPGSITKYKLKPDMATWGKGIANGFSFCALTGTREVMDQGSILNAGEEKVFLISTTHGGETHGLAAAIACIDFHEKNPVIDHLHKTGERIIELTNHLISKHGLDMFIQVIPCNWMPAFVFKDKSGQISQGYRTLFMQEMIARGVLFQGIFVPSYSHSADDIAYFLKAFDATCVIYKEALDHGFENFLVGAPAKPVFRKHL
jgi:glutamate-1-semialdehyde aminotransferase/spore coat polysaccharide biosynthesis protein SpsF (cytidylyltransferase family)